METTRRQEAIHADRASAPAPDGNEASAGRRKPCARSQTRPPGVPVDAAAYAAAGAGGDGDGGVDEHTFSKSDEGLLVELECEDDGMVPVRLKGLGFQVSGFGFRVC